MKFIYLDEPEPSRFKYEDDKDVVPASAPSGDGPSMAQISRGLVAEVAISAGGQAAGAALAPFTLGISYPVAAFSGGVLGSIVAQKEEGRERVSPGRAFIAGIINMVPGSSAVKGVGSAVVRGASRGAAIGTAEATAIATIDEGRLPTLGEVTTYAGVGAGFGGVLGGTMQYGKRLWGKIKNKTPNEVDAAIASGEITPQELMPNSNNPEVNAAMRSVQKAADEIVVAAEEAPARALAVAPVSTVMSRFKDRVQAAKGAVAPSRVLGKDIQSIALQSKQEAIAAEELGSLVAKDIDIFIKKQVDPTDATNRINAYMDGKVNSLPSSYKSIQSEIDLTREKMQDLQAKLVTNIDSGITPATPEMRAIVARSMDEGNYLTREFRFFTDKDYWPTQKKLDAVRVELGDDAEDVLAALNSKKLSSIENRNFLPTAIDGFLRKRKDLGPALLDYLGEITEPGERIRGTLTRLARGVYRDEADAAIKNLLLQRGLGSRNPTPGGVELTLRRFEKDGTGVYVAPYVQQALDQVYSTASKNSARIPVVSGLADIWNTGVGLSKAVKVLLNPPSYAVQVYGNTANLLGMGINPFDGAGRGLRLALSEYGPINRLTKDPSARVALLRDINEMSRYGIKGTNILDSDIRSSLERGIFSDTAQKAINPIAKAYTTPDTMGRFVAWKHHQRLFRDMFPTANEETIKQFAANVTNDVYQNYPRLSRTGRELSRIGLIPQFASFTMEFARNQYNQGRFIKQMMQGSFGKGVQGLGPANMNAMRVEAGRRLSAILGVYGLTYASVKAWNATNGAGEEVAEALKETALPEYDQDRLLAMSYDAETGKGKYANPSYVVPHAVALSALDKGLKGEPISGVSDVIINEFVGEGSFLARSVFSAVFNTDPRNRKKITAEVERYKRVKDLVSFTVRDAFEPGFAREVRKFQQARRGQGDLTVGDVGRRQLGVRLNSFDAQESARFRVKENVDNSRLVSSRYVSARDYRNLSPQQVQQEYTNANATHRANMQKIIRHTNNMLGPLAFSQEQTVEVLKGAGLGNAAILDTLAGRVSDLPLVKRTTPTSIWEENISQLSKNEQVREINRIGRTDPMLARSLVSILKSDRRAEALGITGTDRLYMGLGAGDGTRAEYLYRASLESPDPVGFLNDKRRKGIITPQVAQQLRQLEQADSQNQPY